LAVELDLYSGHAQAERLERVAAELNALLCQPEAAQRAHVRPAQEAWSAIEILGHMAEMIPYWLNHCDRLVAATDEPPVFGRNLDAPERLAGVERGASGDLAELVNLVDQEIEVAAHTIRQLSPVDRARQGIHSRYGAINVAQVIEQFIVAHAEEHLAQIQTALGG
jgi:hypothetical protein